MSATETSVLVSICIPTRGDRAEYLREAIASLLGQKLSDIEVLVQEDGDSDPMRRLVAAVDDRRVSYAHNGSSLGAAASWLAALDRAQGMYCAFLSDDDRWDPSFLQRLVEPLERDPTLDLAFCDQWVIDGAGRVLAERSDELSRRYGRAGLPEGAHRPYWGLALKRLSIAIGASVFRRSRLIEAGASVARGGRVIDYYIAGRLSLSGAGAYYVQDRLASVREHTRSATTVLGAAIWHDMRWACADLASRAQRHLRGAILERWGQAVVEELLALRRAGRLRSAASTLVASFADAPGDMRGELAKATMLAALSRLARFRGHR